MILSRLEDGVICRTELDAVCFAHECDVLCVGAGSAGVYAAEAAAREGARVILCEISANLGGMHVCGNVTGYYYGARGGRHEEIQEKMAADGTFLARGYQWEQKQIYLSEQLREAGVTVLCRHSATGVLLEGERIVGLMMFDGERELAIRAAVTIDATSDGHLVRMLPVAKRYGKPSDGSYVPFTVRAQYMKNGSFLSCNEDSGHMDHYDAAAFSRGTVMAHASLSRLLDEGEFINLALQVGVREGLTFEGEESIRYSDVLLEREPKRVLFWAYSDLDRHGCERATDEELFQSFWVVANLATVTVSIPVPMGSVVPRGYRGLVTAGRCLSCDTYLQSAVRMNRDMFRMGECVGVAAAMAALAGCDFLTIDYEDFLARVERRGCFHGYADRRFGFDNTYAAYLRKMKALGREPDPCYEGMAKSDYIYEPITFDFEKTAEALKTDAPGVAIWSAYRSHDQEGTAECLVRKMQAAESPLHRNNCAIALGLMGDGRALPTLRSIVRERDCFFFTDNRRSNQFRSAVAVCLLGRLGDESDLPLLYELLEEEEITRPMYHTLPADYLYHPQPDRNFVYFAIATHTCMALYKIFRRHALPMEELKKRLAPLLGGEVLLRRLTDAPAGTPAHEEISAFVCYMERLLGI